MQFINYKGNDNSWFTKIIHPENGDLIALYKNGQLIKEYGKR